MMERTILHVDMNAFFAAVEQQANPALRGRPVAVIGSAQRTVILTASYEARAYGVKTGQTVGEARRLCADLRLVPASNRLYTHVSRQIAALLADYTPLLEVCSIDEAFLDLTGSLALFGGAERVARLIKSRISARFGLTCSIGIAPNKLLAKLAAELQKPDGLTLLAPHDVSRVLAELPVTALCGIGRRTAQQLRGLGITTCGELGRFPLAQLTRRFGVLGERLQQMGLGIDPSPVVPAVAAGPVKSIGHSTTLPRDLHRREELLAVLLQLCEMVGRRARRAGMRGRTVTLTVRYADFTTFSRQERQASSLDQSADLYRAALRILDGLELAQPVRLLGVTLSSLEEHGLQLSLLPDEQRRQRAAAAMDMVNDRYGEFTLQVGSLLERPDAEKASQVIAPSWQPAGVRYVDVS